MGNLLAWRRKNETHLEYELVTQLHLESSSINKITAVAEGELINLFVQVKLGEILGYQFDGSKFVEMAELRIKCGTFTFCRMSSLKIESTILLAYPSAHLENAINVLRIPTSGSDGSRTYLLKDYLVKSSGMCLFTKLIQNGPIILLICGYESGKLVILDISHERSFKVLFEERVFEESCTDAEMLEETIVVVGAGKTVKIIRDCFQNEDSTKSKCTIELPFPGCNSVAIRPDGKLFVTGGWDCKLRFFSLKSGKLLAVVDHHFEAISEVKFVGAEKYFTVAASLDGTISLWALFN